MQIEQKGFSSIIPDNEVAYFSLLEGVLCSVDVNFSMLITRKINSVGFRIAPSSPLMLNSLIEEINRVNTLLGIRVDFSKSIKSSYVINFEINF